MTFEPSGTSDSDASPGAPWIRQRVLVLYLRGAALDAGVTGWTYYDGTSDAAVPTGDEDTPPYKTGLDALRDGWRLFQAAQLLPPQPGHEYDTSFLKHEFWFEKLVEAGHE